MKGFPRPSNVQTGEPAGQRTAGPGVGGPSDITPWMAMKGFPRPSNVQTGEPPAGPTDGRAGGGRTLRRYAMDGDERLSKALQCSNRRTRRPTDGRAGGGRTLRRTPWMAMKGFPRPSNVQTGEPVGANEPGLDLGKLSSKPLNRRKNASPIHWQVLQSPPPPGPIGKDPGAQTTRWNGF